MLSPRKYRGCARNFARLCLYLVHVPMKTLAMTSILLPKWYRWRNSSVLARNWKTYISFKNYNSKNNGKCFVKQKFANYKKKWFHIYLIFYFQHFWRRPNVFYSTIPYVHTYIYSLHSSNNTYNNSQI